MLNTESTVVGFGYLEWAGKTIKEQQAQIADLVAALEAIELLAKNPNHRTARTQIQMCSFFDDIVLPIIDKALVQVGDKKPSSIDITTFEGE